jgi:hypothetical protein
VFSTGLKELICFCLPSLSCLSGGGEEEGGGEEGDREDGEEK